MKWINYNGLNSSFETYLIDFIRWSYIGRDDKKSQLARRSGHTHPARLLPGWPGIVMGQIRLGLKTDQVRFGLNSKPTGSSFGLYLIAVLSLVL